MGGNKGRHALVTGGAGFIGSHLVDALLSEGWNVTAVDNFDPFYDPMAKERNVAQHLEAEEYTLCRLDVRDAKAVHRQLNGDYDVIVHLAARAGVRPSIEAPAAYREVNVGGTHNMLEFARQRGIGRFVFASSSSVYGKNPAVPWSEEDTLLPISPYAATKAAAELMGHAYSHLHELQFVALRYFTVYGPRQRPDLALHKFARLMLADEPLPLYGDGSSRRDYTYVADIVRGTRAAMEYEGGGYEVFNLGSGRPVSLLDMVKTLQEALELEPQLKWLPEQPGDVEQTWADIDRAAQLLGYEPQVEFGEGVHRLVQWFRTEKATG